MYFIQATITPEGVLTADIEAPVTEIEHAREFYAQVKPLLNELSQKVRGLQAEAQGEPHETSY